MGLFDFISKFKKQKESKKYADMLNGYTPIYSQFGNDIYASDVVQQAISCIVSEMKKLNPRHVRDNGADTISVDGEIQKLLDYPNSLMTQTDFLEKIFWQLFLNYNSFIIPTYDIHFDANGNKVKSYTGLYPIQPSTVEFLQDNSGTIFLKLHFINNYETTLKYDDIIHVRYRYSINEYMGGNNFGQPDNKALLKTLELNDDLLKGISAAMKSSYSINGIIKYNTLLDDGEMENNIKKLEQHLKSNESGFLPMDIKGEFIPLQNRIQLVDSETLKFIDEKILRNFGVPLSILTGDYTTEQYSAFYQKTLEPLIISISQAFTKTLFTDREKSFKNRIVFYPKELVFMNTQEKLEMVRLLGDAGSLYENEKRVAFGLRPLKELEGVRMMSLNYVNVDDAKQYQTGQIQEEGQQPLNNENGDENNAETTEKNG